MPFWFKACGFGLLLTVIGLFMVQRDVRLRIWGETTDAEISAEYISNGRRGRQSQKIEYDFNTKDGLKKGGFTAPSGWIRPADGNIKIVYLPYDVSISRWEGESATWAYVLLIGGLGLGALGVYLLLNESVVDSHNSETPISATPKTLRRMGLD